MERPQHFDALYKVKADCNVLRAVFLLLLGLMVTGLSVLLFQLYGPVDPLFEVKQSPWLVVNDPSPGNGVYSEIDFCKFRDTPTTIHRMLVGETRGGKTVVMVASTVGGLLPAGCRKVTVQVIDLPIDLPAGRYKVLVHFTYRVTPLREHTEMFETESFETEEPEDP